MCGRIARFLFGLWLATNGVLTVTRALGDRPMETFVRMTSLTSTIVDISAYRRCADTIYTILGALYIFVGIHCMYVGKLGPLLAILLSMFVSVTFDNPLFSDYRKNEKVVMLFSHLLICTVALAMCCTCGCEEKKCCCTEANKKKSVAAKH